MSPHSVPQAHDVSSKAAESGLLSAAIKFASIFVVGGYVSLRAYLNHLGIPSMSSLGSERYLMEAYGFAMAVAFPLFQILLPAAALAVLAGIICDRTRLHGLLHDTAAKCERAFHSLWLPVALVLVNVTAGFVAIATLLNGGSDIAVGALHKSRFQSRSPYGFFALVLIVTVTASIYAYARERQLFRSAGRSYGRVAWFLVSCSLFVLIVQLPIVYGYAIRESKYPVASVVLDGEPDSPFCGLLLLQSNDELVLWRTAGKFGQMTVLPKSRVLSMRVGKLADLFEIARASADAKPSGLDCSALKGA